MKPGAPWSIKGVDPDAREIAKAKARASDMTLGQWLNQAIADADKPPVTAAAPVAQGGSSLDTARLMRAISEVARRVDQVRDAPAAAVDTSKIEQSLAVLARRMEALEQRAPAAPDMSGLAGSLNNSIAGLAQKLGRIEEQVAGMTGGANVDAVSGGEGTDAVLAKLNDLNERLDTMAHPVSSEGDPAVQADMRRVMNGMLNLARKIDGVEAQVAGQMAPLKAEIAELRSASGSPAADAQPDTQREAIEAIHNDVQELKRAIAAQSAPPAASERDLRPDIALALAPVMARLSDLQARIEEASVAAAEPTDIDAAPVLEPVHEQEPEPEPEPEPAAPSEQSADLAEAADATVPDETTQGDPDDAPMQRPEPGALQALHDLTARRDSVSRRVEPILRDLPEPDQATETNAAPEPPLDAHRAVDDDDRPDFDAPNDLTGVEPAAASPLPDTDPVAESAASEPASATETSSDIIQDPIDQPLENRDSLDGGEGGDIPETAAAPDRPRRIVPVENLLDGGDAARADDTRASGGFDDDDDMRSPNADVAAASVASPMAAQRIVVEEPRERRRGLGYLVAALLFLALLIGGFFFIGSDRFGQWVEQGKTVVAGLADMVPVPDSGSDAGPDTGPDTGSGPAGTAADGTAAQPTAAANPAAPAAQTGETISSAPPVPDTAAPVRQDAAEPLSAAAPDTLASARANTVAEPEPAAPAGAANPAETSLPAATRTDLATLQAQAEAGDAEAQFLLGVRYRDGDGIGVSYGESAAWFQQAAEQGHVPAQVNLGIFYRQGVGVAKDVDLAKVWFHAAARAGHPEAQNFLGQVYVGEDQERPDYFQAARWFREAAEQGVLDAQYNLASLYMGGLGVPRDDAQAYFWFGVAARQGDTDAAANQANVGAEMAPAERTEQDQRIASFQAIPQYALQPSQAVNAISGSAEIRRRDQIRLVQRLLISRGYDPGQPDGLPGEQTRQAIRQFETDNGLTVTGRITEPVLQALQQGG
ncbi:MAG: SEL1-like repeat protein [Minwuia sp.]|nr:SEL1-like repeat protein [Minwuia sp.]